MGSAPKHLPQCARAVYGHRRSRQWGDGTRHWLTPLLEQGEHGKSLVPPCTPETRLSLSFSLHVLEAPSSQDSTLDETEPFHNVMNCFHTLLPFQFAALHRGCAWEGLATELASHEAGCALLREYEGFIAFRMVGQRI